MLGWGGNSDIAGFKAPPVMLPQLPTKRATFVGLALESWDRKNIGGL